MKIITLDDKIIYRADEGKKVRFKRTDRLYSEITVPVDDEREVEEVEAENGNS